MGSRSRARSGVCRRWRSAGQSRRSARRRADRFLETTTGGRFGESRFREVMALVNEQEEWNRKTRDLIARTRPAPIGVNDGIPAVMLPQWHRGTEWARDAARSLYEEVRAGWTRVRPPAPASGPG
ncbi:2-hydroxyacyl-CoA dehydratase family protein [Nonomuraea insulae]|uniref:2-hydroxyacyl-CoA dehydratase family protein n=1 Tax=Nonomuraea insulae TaxID=1616787 RepID=A0ABW1CQ93_9ACTN